MSAADQFLRTLAKTFPRLKYPAKGRRFVSGWAARCCTVAADDVSFKIGRGGFPAEVLAEFYERGGPICDTHDGTRPVGKTVSYQITPSGVWLVAEVAQGDAAADRCWREIMVGKKAGFSIRWQQDPAGTVLVGGLHLTKAARVVEVSVVATPSEPLAAFLIGRHENPTATPTVSTPSTRSRMAARAKLFLKEVLHQ